MGTVRDCQTSHDKIRVRGDNKAEKRASWQGVNDSDAGNKAGLTLDHLNSVFTYIVNNL